jgi:hypothetical protein
MLGERVRTWLLPIALEFRLGTERAGGANNWTGALLAAANTILAGARCVASDLDLRAQVQTHTHGVSESNAMETPGKMQRASSSAEPGHTLRQAMQAAPAMRFRRRRFAPAPASTELPSPRLTATSAASGPGGMLLPESAVGTAKNDADAGGAGLDMMNPLGRSRRARRNCPVLCV